MSDPFAPRVVVKTPATSANLGPGFDCLGLALDLYDILTLETAPRDGHAQVIVHGEGRDRLPCNERNLALRAAQRVLRAAGAELHVARLTMKNAIPIGGGLGSSAAAIIGGVVAANHAAGSPFDAYDLLRFALEIENHGDNLAPALHGGVVVVALDNGRPIIAPLPPPPGLRAVVLTPDLSISTHQSRATLPRAVPHGDAAFNTARSALLVAALSTGDYKLLGTAMEDRLHQPQRGTAFPLLPAAIAAAREAGAYGAALSGSGPSVLALCGESTDVVKEAMRAVTAAAGFRCTVRELAIVAHGAAILDDA